MLPQIATAYDRNPARIQMIIRKNRNQKKRDPHGRPDRCQSGSFRCFQLPDGHGNAVIALTSLLKRVPLKTGSGARPGR